jgi:uncharacterized protein (TIGR00369 family)
MTISLIEAYKKSNHFGKWLGMDFKIVLPGEVEYRMTIQENHLATPLSGHGGVIASLMDATLGVSGLSAVHEEGMVVSTIEMKMNFLAPAKLDDQLIGNGKVISKGKRILYIEAEIKTAEGVLISKGSGTFLSYPKEKAGY